MPSFQSISLRARQSLQTVSGLTQREKQHLYREMQQTRGLIPILMKQRNGQRWSTVGGVPERQVRRHQSG